MYRVFACLLVVLLFARIGGFASAESEIVVRVDPRIELMSIICRTADFFEYRQARIDSYAKAVDEHFADHANHPAVQFALALRQQRKLGFNYCMAMAVHLDEENWTPRSALENPRLQLYVGDVWEPSAAVEFARHAQDFARVTQFDSFLEGHKDLFEEAESRMQRLIEEQGDLAWFERFFGDGPQSELIVNIGLLNGGANYAAQFKSDDLFEFHAIIGAARVDQEELPIFGTSAIATIVHEFAHCFVNPVVQKHQGAFEPAAVTIFSHVAPYMRRQMYGHWKIMIDESIVRAAVIRYTLEHDGILAAAKLVESERDQRQFFWIEELSAMLGRYERNRHEHPDFESLVPKLVGYFEDVAPQVPAMVEEFEANSAAKSSPK